MTREAAGTVSVPRDNARSERVCGGVSAVTGSRRFRVTLW